MTRSMTLALALMALAPAAVARDISGQMAYRERIALVPEAQLVVELRGPGGVVAEARIETEGRQVPLPFAIVAPDNGAYSLRGAIFVGGRAEWASGQIEIAAGEGAVDLGALTLTRPVASGLSTRMDCGGTSIDVGFLDQSARLRVGGEAFVLQPTVSASGALYSDGAQPETRFWGKGNAALVTLRGVDLPECRPVIADPLVPLRARGNEPGWTLEVTEAGFLYLGDMGANRIEAALPVAQPTEDGARFDVSESFGFGIERRLCHDDMSGMPFPVSVSVADKGRVLLGCGGAPADLLAGSWAVDHLEGATLPEKDGVTMQFDVSTGSVSGHGGCNRFNGAFTLTGEGLTFGPAASTMMACPEDQMQVEMTLHKVLATVDRFDIAEDGALELIAGGTVVVRARR